MTQNSEHPHRECLKNVHALALDLTLIVKLLCFGLKEILRVSCIILRGSYTLSPLLPQTSFY